MRVTILPALRGRKSALTSLDGQEVESPTLQALRKGKDWHPNKPIGNLGVTNLFQP